jgi:hypothetical protein
MKDPRDCPECNSVLTESIQTYFSEKKKVLLDERYCDNCQTAYDVHWRHKKTETLGTL